MSPVKPATPVKVSPKKAPGGCQIGELLRLLGESHVLDLLYVFLDEPKPRRFVQIQSELQMSPNTLSDRLRALVKAGLLTRTAYNEIPPRVEYAPTAKAIEFQAVFENLKDWAKRNDLQPIITPTP